MSPRNIGKHLHSARLRRKLTREQLSRASGAGLTTILNFEFGKHTPYYSTVEAIANSLGYELVLQEIKRDG